jgi:hypothetical protein
VSIKPSCAAGNSLINSCPPFFALAPGFGPAVTAATTILEASSFLICLRAKLRPGKPQ